MQWAFCKWQLYMERSCSSEAQSESSRQVVKSPAHCTPRCAAFSAGSKKFTLQRHLQKELSNARKPCQINSGVALQQARQLTMQINSLERQGQCLPY